MYSEIGTAADGRARLRHNDGLTHDPCLWIPALPYTSITVFGRAAGEETNGAAFQLDTHRLVIAPPRICRNKNCLDFLTVPFSYIVTVGSLQDRAITRYA